MLLRMRNRPALVSLAVFTWFSLSACDAEDATSDSGDEVVDDPQFPPTGDAELRTWLAAEHYRDWASESAIHSSAGPHFGNVRTWLNTAAIAGLESAADEFAIGAATVKELYGSGDQRRGWSVSVRTAAGPAEKAWFWYEVYDGQGIAADHGVDLCLNCHAAGQDYVVTPYPLQ